MNMKTLLREEFESEMKDLSRLEVGSDQYRTAVEGVTKLADRLIEIDKIDVESEARAEALEVDKELKLKQMDDEKKDRLVRNIITAVTAAGGFAIAYWGTLVSMAFEKEDSFTSHLGRKWVDRTMSFIRK